MTSSSGLASRLSTAVAAVLPERLVAAAIRAVYPRVEPELAHLGEFVPRGGTAVDVGAWYGPWTARLTRLADLVVAVEPTSQLAAHLRASFPTVDVVEAAASDHDGAADLYVAAAGPIVGVSSLDRGAGQNVGRVSVRLVTIDGLALRDVRFIKLDIEGHELAALRGAAETIARDRPVLLVELEERVQPIEPILDLLGAWGYRGLVRPQDRWVPIETFDLAAHQRASIARVRQSFVRRVVLPRPRYVNSVLFRPN